MWWQECGKSGGVWEGWRLGGEVEDCGGRGKVCSGKGGVLEGMRCVGGEG